MITDIIANFANIGQIFTNLSKLQKLFNIFIDLIKNGPADIKACSDIVQMGSQSVNWIIKHISLTTLTTGLIANLVANILTIATDGMDITSALFAKDYYRLGKDGGEIFMMLFN